MEDGRLVDLGDSAGVLVLLVHGVVVQLRVLARGVCINWSRSSSA